MPSAAQPPHAESLSFLLSQVGAACAASFTEGIAPLGLSPRGYGVLSLLGDTTPTQQQLADSIGVHRNVMVNVIDELETARLVKRHRDPEDRRAFRIHITARGEKLLARAATAVGSLDQRVAAALTPEQEEALTGALLAVADSLGLERGLHPSMSS